MSDFDPTLNAWLPVPTHCDALAVPYWLAQSEQTPVGFSPDPQLKPLINASDHLLPMLQQDPARDLITGQLRSGSYSYDLNLELAGTAITMSGDRLAQDRQDVSLTIDRTTVDLLIRPRRIFLRSDGERWIVLNQDRLLTRTFSEALGSLIRSLSVPQMLRRLSRVATMEQCNQSTDSRPQRADVRVGDWSALIPRSFQSLIAEVKQNKLHHTDSIPASLRYDHFGSLRRLHTELEGVGSIGLSVHSYDRQGLLNQPMRDQRIPIVSAEGRNLFMDAFPDLAKHLPVLPRPHVRSHLEDFDHGFPTELAERAHQATLPVLLSGGDEAVYFAAHTDEFFATVRVEPQQPARHLTKNLNQKIGSIKADTLHMGNPTLDEYLQAPESYSQAFVVVHRGEVVYEQYPRMQSGDSHVWMSAAKVTASLLVDLLIEEGRINEDQPIGDYLPHFRGTPTAQVPVKDVLAMSTGLDTEENDASRSDPDSLVSRMFLAEFGMPYQGRVESLVDVLRSAKLSSQPGESFQYSSATTQLLVLLAEAVEAKPWQDIFAERVWAKLGVEQAIQLHQSPDGIVAAHGLISSTLRDLARFGVLYTPSWHKVASERVVGSGVIDRIRESVRSREFFMAGSSGPRFLTHFQDPTILSSSRQWDVVWPDGDFWKGGIMGQGLYISPDKDLVIAYFSVNAPDRSIDRFVRPIATSRWFS